MEKQTNLKLVTTAVFIANFMTAIEGTIVTTAMPTIVGSLQGIELMNWVFAIYLLVSAMGTPIYGKLADTLGRKPIFIFGTSLFIIGSALCGFANSMETLIVARGIQGLGAGAMMPVSLTIIADLYTKEKRAKVLGWNSTAWGIASVIGPLAGGLIVDTIGWHWIFFINVPIGLILLFLIGRYLVEPKQAKTSYRLDYLGSIALMFTLLALLLGFQLLGEQGLTNAVFTLFGGALISFFLFMKQEKRAIDPVIDLQLLQNSLFIIVNVVAALASGFVMSMDVYIPMWMQGVLGLPAGIGGLVLAPLSILWLIGSFLAGRWMGRYSMKLVLLMSLGITLISAAWLYLIPMATSWLWFFAISSVAGIGLGATMVATTVCVQNSVAKEQLGVATSFNTLARTIGQTVLVAIFGLLMNQISARELQAAQITDGQTLMNQLVNPQTAQSLPADLVNPLKEILYTSLHGVFGVGLIVIVLALLLVGGMKAMNQTKV
ncbi:MAG: MDR family MFS transporter [Enterococcus sp.]